jgi:hypothetical protein
MKLRMTWVLCGGILALSTSLGMASCGSSGGTGTDGGGGSGGSEGTKGTKGTAGAGGSQGSGGGAGTAGAAGSGGTMGTSGDGGAVDCGSAPSLHTETKAGVYCPFSTIGDGGKAGTCTAGEVCCQTLSADAGASTCEPAGTLVAACPAPTESVVWECEDPIDCVGNSNGTVCCGFGTAEKEAPSCTNYDYVSGAKGMGSVCATSCAGGNIICETNAECGDAGTCTPVKYHGNQVGFCCPGGVCS